ncbi:N-acetylmuramoyl-L-alanine amidase [Kitasatospora sp. NPDC058201]|uniref:peptidoglycan recognition protein family protein n=1 Tax=unclassified Kitasatospora TaxID=2633591 RepID=UPI00365799AB
MAWFPGAEKMELQPESDEQPAIVPTQLIFHSIAAPWTPRRTYQYWRDSTNLESHFGVGYDGSVGQFVGTETRADANAAANRRGDRTGAVSVETAADNDNSDPWTDAQVEALVRIGVWMHQQHGIPLRICRTPDDPGYGYHRLHRSWSTSGTACPGDARVAQFHERVFPAIVARATGATAPPTPKPTPEEDPLASITIGDIEAAVRRQLDATRDLDTHSVLYWLLQSLKPDPADPGDHPLRWVVGPLGQALRSLPQTTQDQVRAAVEQALADGLELNVTTKGN